MAVGVTLLAAALLGASCAEPNEERGEAAPPDRRAASTELAAYGVAAYAVTTEGASAAVQLYDAAGRRAGELMARNPGGAAELELRWQGHTYTFGLHVRLQDSLAIATDTASGTVYAAETGDQITGDAASLALYRAVEPQWRLVAKLFDELELKKIGASWPTKGPSADAPQALYTPQAVAGVVAAGCSYCDAQRNCNFLQWSRQYHGTINAFGQCQGASYCGCDCNPPMPWPCNP
ncbi:MAG TPA: hypothetical protein VFS00_28200 [Polyangiaceae bacterium]|nr:hypothetical protein [Polyangiaceae bacterium]